MIPPMPPTMPPWPGNKPPWEAIRELEAKRAREQEEAAREAAAKEAAAKEAAAREAEQRARQQAQQQPFQPWMVGGPRAGAMPIIVHGLLPPQMIQHTMPLWVGPSMVLPGMQQAPAGHQPQPQQQPVQQAPPQQVQAQRPAASSDGSTTTLVPQGPGQPPLRVERSAPEQEQGAQLHPVMPVQTVFNVGLPTGARARRF